MTGLVGNKRKKSQRTEREQKQLAHVRNFDPTRLNNQSWQIRAGKKMTKKQRKYCYPNIESVRRWLWYF